MKSNTAKTVALGLVGILLGGAVLGGCGKKDAGGGGKRGKGPQSAAVVVTPVKTGTISQTVDVTGSIAALQDVSLAARITARVATVAAREGDFVRAGQLIVQQDTTDLQANVRQAQANVVSNEAKLSQAQTNYQLAVTQAKQAVAQARAQVASAQQNYSKLKGGSRPQQVLQGQAQVAQAQANFDNAKTNLERYKSLYAQGAVAKADLDTTQTTYNVDAQLLKNAQATLSLTKAGYQQQDVAAGLAQVQQQQASLQNAIGNVKTISLRRDDILAAQAAIVQARAALAYAQEQVAFASIRSPIDGIVAARQTEPGQIAQSGTTIMRIVNVKTVYYQPTISETDFAKTSVGDPVAVQVDALPGKTYSGKVVAVYPAASASNRVFSLRVVVPNPTNDLRPGMFARGQVYTAIHRNVVVIPVSALLPQQTPGGFQIETSSQGVAGGGTSLPPQQVFLAGAGSKAVVQPVKVGIVTTDQAEIINGLKPGDSLITTGQNLVQPGDPIRVQKADGSNQVAQADAAQ